MARTTIRRKLTLLFGTTIIIVVALVGLLVSHQMSREMFSQARRTGLALTRSIAAAASNDFFSYNFVGLEQKAEEAVRDPDVAYVILYDKEGKIAAFSGQGRPDAETDIPPLPEKGLSQAGHSIHDGLVLGGGGRGLDIVVGVTMPTTGDQWGTVRLGMKLDGIFNQIERARWTVFFLGVAGILLGWLLAAMFTKRITVPLKDLLKATTEVSDRKQEVNLDIHTGDEIEDLADNFRSMAERVKEQWRALEANLEEIRELKHFSDLVILSVTNGLFTLDEGGRIVIFNRKAEEILKIDSGCALDRTPRDVWGSSSGLATISEEGLAGKGSITGRRVLHSIDGEERYLEVTAAPVRDRKAPMKGLLVLFEDLTERRELEDRVRRADRLADMGTLAAGLAHEIKNPLTAVRTFVQMFPERYAREDFREKFNKIVPKELQRVNGLLEDLLDLVRKPRLRIIPLEAPAVMQHVLDTLHPEVEKRGLDVNIRGAQGAGKVLADESYLIRAVHNVVLNAIQAMPGGGELNIEYRAGTLPGQGPATEIVISDTGPGIPADQVDDIFNPFFTSKEMGTGLGLAVTNKVIEDQGGAVKVSSERARGTEFIISLPALDEDRLLQ